MDLASTGSLPGLAQGYSVPARSCTAWPILSRHIQCSRRGNSLQTCHAISKEQKEKTLTGLVPLFEKSSVVVGLRYKGLTVKQMEDFRRLLPESAKFMVCKNTLVNIASQRVPGWVNLEPAAKGDNAWLFIEEEDIAKVAKSYLQFQGDLRRALPTTLQATMRPLDVSGGVIEGQSLDYDMMKKLEKMPSRKELMATVAGLLKQVPVRVALAIKAVPTKLSRGMKALADADEEDKSKLIGKVFPRQGAAESTT